MIIIIIIIRLKKYVDNIKTINESNHNDNDHNDNDHNDNDHDDNVSLLSPIKKQRIEFLSPYSQSKDKSNKLKEQYYDLWGLYQIAEIKNRFLKDESSV